MSKFKVGDRVKTIRDTPDVDKGAVGTVEAEGSGNALMVRFNDYGGSYLCYSDELELINTAPPAMWPTGTAGSSTGARQAVKPFVGKRIKSSDPLDITRLVNVGADNLEAFSQWLIDNGVVK